ncbi:DNA polymerase III subunits gamma and tau [Leifsonia xyli subsp. cynodontis DSM 46306]|uniref:DNA-directed DNA polymerase n=1 Tax=Leifsonia xyli subsp. cynodontis DSM 46306 TaxID=1389489 RepID=U3P949_LEIXC|nr:DNA polymerase III subunit gamma and tau [Leifsonia xyli]AGW42351.1 DNA polymerase III subunits gamma and tau [Leifsonia xyli subsp. cynodontis DSM 46306]
MVTALYRRYRPDTFTEMIGQSQVTDPLRTALRTNRVNHAYLFSGPRGCGKTTSARILARCLNCAEGPTDTPCGTCPSCVELSRDGGGSLDVVEIDAASHNGVDDARDIRERAIFAPARDRYKLFILDEAHMVTPQGFNALLKIVEEPPEHVKFIFATTEPEKVIGTIRSRTHHYPFRLVPPAQMLEYVQGLCDSEGMTVAPGVLPLVVRAGGGSPRDTLSLLDQLMAGSEGSSIEYERAVALLGYTHAALLDEVVDAIAARDAAGAFAAVDRVIQTGQDPRRFVDDLLERLRDLIVVAATSVEGAAAVLRGVPADELDKMGMQAMMFGAAELSRSADIVNAALTEMTGATSPRLHLELMIARVLVPSGDDTERGALARVERLERRVGVSDAAGGGPTRGTAPAVAAPATRSAPAPEPPAIRAAEPAAKAEPTAGVQPPARTEQPARAEEAAPEPDAVVEPQPEPAAVAPAEAVTAPPIGPVTTQQVKDSWPQILDAVQRAKRSAWMVVFTAQVRALSDDVLTLSFPSDNDVQSFRQPPSPGTQGVSEYLRQAIVDILGIRVKFIARADGGSGSSGPGAQAVPAAEAWPGAGGPGAAPHGGGGPSDGVPDRLASEDLSSGSPVSGRPAPGASPSAKAPPEISGSGVAADAGAEASGAARAASRSAAAPSSGPVTEWATVAIPVAEPVGAASAVVTLERPEPAAVPVASRAGIPPRGDTPLSDDVPPEETEPPFEPDFPEEPDFPKEPDEDGAVVPPPPAGSAPAPSTAPAQHPALRTAPAAAPATGTRTPTFQAPQRYGEAVVREILGATFLEEQPAPSNPGTR